MKPGLLMLPSAVSDSRVHNILPNKIDTDFQFSRASSATRVNHQGLIEDVGYFGPELVQNGNFSELGSEKATNGNFDNGSTNWTLIGDVSIGNGVCTFFDTGSNTNSQLISQTGILANKTYKLVFDVTRYVAGSIQLIFGGAAAVNVNITGGVGTYTVYVVNGASTMWLIKRDGGYPGFDFDIDNISVKQVDPDDDWTLDTNWAYGNNKIIGSAATGENQQNLVLPSGKQYLTSFTIEDYVSGTVRIRFRGGSTVNGTARSGNGTYTQILTSTGHTNIRIDGGTAFTGSVTNVSVVEVIGDKPRLDYDPTNPTCPHLLLEPQSTNLITFSEDFNSSLYTETNITVTSNSIISPDGTKNASMLTDDSTNGEHRLTTSSLFTADGNNRCWSIFVKKGTSRYCAFNHVAAFSSSVNTIIFDFDTATYSSVGTAAYMDEVFPPQNYGNGWYKISFRSDINSSSYTRLNIGLSSGPAYNDASYAGTGDTMYIWGGQVEQQDYVTSYIPTSGSQETRVAETCNNAGNVNTFNSEEGVLYLDFEAQPISTYSLMCINNGTNAEVVTIGKNTNSTFFIGVRSGSVYQADLSGVGNTNVFNKVAISYKVDDFKIYVNGNLEQSDNSGSVPTGLNQASFDFTSSSFPFYGKVKSLATYNRALTDTELYTITSTQYSAYSGMVAALGNYTIPC